MNTLNLPARLAWTDPSSFANLTVRQRFPRFIETLAEDNLHRPSAPPALRDLHSRILADDPASTDDLLGPTPFWAERLRAWHGARYSSLCFFELEFLFHHAINCHYDAYAPSRDPFATRKQRDTEESLEESERAAAALDSLRCRDAFQGLETALLSSAFGNAADASQLKRSSSHQFGFHRLVDGDTATATATVTKAISNGRKISILLDNAGPELGMDLLLAHHILETSDTSITLHAKPWPMFVSDATVRDVREHIERWRTSKLGLGRLAAVGRDLDHAIASGKLQTTAEPEWGEPRHFDDLEDETLARLSSRVSLVISKGDLNYRRHFGDRDWPHYTALETAAHGVELESILLRVLKSEILVGMSRERCAALDLEDPDWMSNGRFGIIQHASPQETRACNAASQ